MFTGIVEASGTVIGRADRRLEVFMELEGLCPGESIAVNGVCLTVTSFRESIFVADLSEQTCRLTSLGSVAIGDRVNLERAMLAGGRFGGHLVQGHVDGVGRVVEAVQLAGSLEVSFELPGGLERYLVEKGSVTVEGVSLTVAGLSGDRFTVSLVPHTLANTTFVGKKTGDPVNVEVDVLAKYVERLLQAQIRR
ncbi:MAG: riboflavin synthase [Actinomycetota bacterium]